MDKHFTRTANAAAWAEAFCELLREHPGDLDEEFMTGWFANAMMIGRDEAQARLGKILLGQRAEMRSLSYHISHHCHRHPRVHRVPETETERVLEDSYMRDRSLLTFVREHLVRLDAEEFDLTKNQDIPLSDLIGKSS